MIGHNGQTARLATILPGNQVIVAIVGGFTESSTYPGSQNVSDGWVYSDWTELGPRPPGGISDQQLHAVFTGTNYIYEHWRNGPIWSHDGTHTLVRS